MFGVIAFIIKKINYVIFLLRVVLYMMIDIGTKISHHLTEFLVLVAASAEWKDIIRQLDDIAFIFGFPSVEENSIVIKRYLLVLKLLEGAMRESRKCSTEGGKSAYWFGYPKQEHFRLILPTRFVS